MSRWLQATIGVAASVLLLSPIVDAGAQTVAPSQVTPPSLRPAAPQAAPIVVSPAPARRALPPSVAGLSVLVGKVLVEGAFSELAPATDALVAHLTGQRVSLETIYTEAARLEQAYVAAGYPLVRVVLPEQKLLDRGPLRIVVIDGFIATIDGSSLPAPVRSVILKRTASLVGRRHLRQAEIEHALLIAAEVPGVRLRSALARGVAEGAAKLILEGEHHLVSISGGADNRLVKSLGVWQLRGAMTVNSALGWGEQAYGSFGVSANPDTFDAGRPPLLLYGAGLIVPIGNQGLTINPEYTRSVTRTPASANVPAAIGTFERLALRLRDPVSLARSGALYANAALELVDQRADASEFAVPLNHDHYGVLRLGPDYSTTLPWGAGLQIAALASVGLGGRGVLDANASGVPLSRLGATPQFVKWSASGHLLQPLPLGLRLDVLASGQYSQGKPLLRPEQIALDGNDAVTAFASGTFAADQGVSLRGELSRPLALQLGALTASLSPYLFGAFGRGWLANASAVEQPAFNAEAVGLGLRSGLDSASGWTRTNLGLEVARGFTDLAAIKAGWRSTVLLTMSF